MNKIKDIINFLESIAPPALQESYDNAGLIVGNQGEEVSGILITLDVTEAVIDEAINKKANLIVAHHPIVFSGLKKITGKNYIERSLIKAIKNDIAIFSAHTNLDNIPNGVNGKICKKLGLENCKILDPAKGMLKKLVTFIPVDDAQKVRDAVFSAGAGSIGNYDLCSFNTTGEGTFRAGKNCNPYVGEIETTHSEKEIRFETIFPSYLQGRIINALLQSHPYEEVAYDIYSLENSYKQAGSGMIGTLPEEKNPEDFLQQIKETFNTGIIKHTSFTGKKIKKVAVCGGAGSFLLNKAIAQNADIFISGDFKYHQFFDAEERIIIADIGHFESEQFTKELFYELLTKNLPKFAIHLSEVNTNPIFYF
jgi:dinuclear metal center YbgI/SA1388 family protein